MKISAILPIKTRGRHYADNIGRCDILFSSLRHFTTPETFSRFLIVVPPDEVEAARHYSAAWGDFPIEIIDESHHLPEFAEFNRRHQIRPWHRQQIIKLYAPALIDTEYFMIFDPDVFATHAFSAGTLLPGGRALTYCQPRLREPHLWRASAELLGQDPHLDRPGIWWTPAILSRTLCQSLHRRLEALYGQDWVRVLLGHYAVDWTEYTLYWLNAEREGLLDQFHAAPASGERALHAAESVWYAGNGGRNLDLWQADHHFSEQGDGIFAVIQSNTRIPVRKIVPKLTPFFPIATRPYQRDNSLTLKAAEFYSAIARRGLRAARKAWRKIRPDRPAQAPADVSRDGTPDGARRHRMLRLALPLTLTLLAPGLARADGSLAQPRLMIFAGPLHREYLGCLNCGEYDVNSVWDGYSPYGWDNRYPNFSHYAQYRLQHGRYSACDRFAPDPPILIDNAGKQYGRLNVSKTRADSICGPHGSPSICQTLTAMCDRNAAVP